MVRPRSPGGWNALIAIRLGAANPGEHAQPVPLLRAEANGRQSASGAHPSVQHGISQGDQLHCQDCKAGPVGITGKHGKAVRHLDRADQRAFIYEYGLAF